MTNQTLKNALLRITHDAHREILHVYDTPFDVDRKSDETPITEADRRAHDVIVTGLTQLDSAIPILSEESELASFSERRTWDSYWLVDPLDGTKEFVKRNGEFTVNIALVESHESRIGIVGRPTEDTIYFGDATEPCALKIQSASEVPISTRPVRYSEVATVQSRRRPDVTAEQFLANLEHEVGSLRRDHRGSSLKFLAIAEGMADLYLQPGGTSEWDTGAAHAVLQAAGGYVMSLAGEPLRYNSSESILNEPFIAIGDTSDGWRETLLRHLAIFDD